MVQPKFMRSEGSVKNEFWDKKCRKLNYCLSEFFRIEMSFDVIYYNRDFDARIKSYNILNLKP